jgi:tRNA 2-selenouridine synthase
VLQQLKKQGASVIDLEQIAKHKGSAFGAIGMGEQPRQEMFENLLAMELYRTLKRAESLPIWLEDESQRIGLVNIPPALWKNMRVAPVYFLEVPFEQRLAYLVSTYGKLDTEKMINAVVRIKKRLGPVDTKNAIQFLLDNNHSAAFSILLRYYDKYYGKALLERDPDRINISKIDTAIVDPVKNAELLLRASAIEKGTTGTVSTAS